MSRPLSLRLAATTLLAAMAAAAAAQLPQGDEHTFPTPVAGPVSPADVLRQTGHWAAALDAGGFPGLAPDARTEATAALARLREALRPVRAWRQLRPAQVERIVADHALAVATLGLGSGERLLCRPAAGVGTRIAHMQCELAGGRDEAGAEARRPMPEATSGRIR